MRRILVLLALAASPLLADTPLPPTPSRYVTDAANVIPDDRENALNEKLAQFDRETTNQVIVYVGRKVPAGTTLEEMGAEAIKTWAVGQAKKDNGAILFLFIDDRKSRIEVGYGLEGVLTDARSKLILVGMRDALRARDYAGAVEAGTNAIIETIKPPAQRVVGRHLAQPPLSAGSDEFILWSLILFVVIGLVGLLVFAALKTDWTTKSSFPSSSGDFSSSSSSSSSGFDSSSSSSSSDFSGGGGSGGGGGASDSW